MGFPTTRWTEIIDPSAGPIDSSERRVALEALMNAYRRPLLAVFRRMGATEDESEDLAQGLLASFLEGGIQKADRNRGRFRNYLYGAARHFFLNSRKRLTCYEPLESSENGHSNSREPVTAQTPEDDFNRGWVQTLLDRVVERVREEYARRLDSDLFERLLPYVSYEAENPTSAELARDLGKTAGAVRQAVTRLRDRLRDEIRKEVAVSTADDAVEDEICFLYRILEKK